MRGTTIEEENILASTTGKKSDQALNQVLTDCCLSVVDPGPYQNMGNKPNWNSMLQGDRFLAMFNLRMLSHKNGEKYEYRSQCPHCNSWTYYESHLVDDFPVRHMTDEMFDKFKLGENPTTEVAGKEVEFRWSLVKDIEKFSSLRKRWPQRKMAVGLSIRLVSVDGVPAHDFVNWLDGGNGKFEPLLSEDVDVLKEKYNEYDVGIDTEIELECDECQRMFEIDLPFEKSFWAPSQVVTRRKKERHFGTNSSESETEKKSSD